MGTEESSFISTYILENGRAVFEPDIVKWAEWYENCGEARWIEYDDLGNGCEVSTVFLGIDYGVLSDSNGPVLYETMVFGGSLDGYCIRSSSLIGSRGNHYDTVARAQIEIRKRKEKIKTGAFFAIIACGIILFLASKYVI